MATLLEKTRKINRVLQRFHNVQYKEIATVLSNVIDANTYIVNIEGEIQGYAFQDDFECSLMVDNVVAVKKFPRHYVNWLNKIDETSANLRSKSGLCAFVDDSETPCKFHGKNTTIVPIYGVGERIGTLIVARYNEDFTNDDLLLVEYGAAVVGMEMLHDQARKNQEENQQRAHVKMALRTLSFSEAVATVNIFAELDGKVGVVNASKIADKLGITRSVIVNALRKLASAGVVFPESQGMKGTHISILNDYLIEGIAEMAKEKLILDPGKN
ncbi:MAG: GTP-sensing pleiotropic transcriptional regulator CodY [Anaerovibrio sp.]|uniref:GTP-sensing pleiotropic transcriptional regulator CodY n=1 Tax=Anaerovibrio sp. TaxID=1872532 RepID=UPI0025CD67CA|nr:GTP-sensing pleiotropic transcriptional regulator CodY [Anaerovibrio sp.]MCR5175896.1 GTP-sensing pleiotropic transcriptional regulator CodY [Anaerovibrio sp.]